MIEIDEDGAMNRALHAFEYKSAVPHGSCPIPYSRDLPAAVALLNRLRAVTAAEVPGPDKELCVNIRWHSAQGVWAVSWVNDRTVSRGAEDPALARAIALAVYGYLRGGKSA